MTDHCRERDDLEVESAVIEVLFRRAGDEQQTGNHAEPEARDAEAQQPMQVGRAQALEQGIDLVRWTFDPLVARNAYFNLHKLGAIADRFGRDFYGPMTDAINQGDRSDRFTVRWDLLREPGPRDVPASGWVLRAEGEAPGEVVAPTTDVVSLEVPRDYPELRDRDRDLASRWRDASASAIEACLATGMVAVGFDLERSAYVLARREAVPA